MRYPEPINDGEEWLDYVQPMTIRELVICALCVVAFFVITGLCGLFFMVMGP